MDLEGVMSLYAPDIVSFDLVPPLRHVGAKAKEKNWATLFCDVPASARFLRLDTH
jgi:ketosteroid isomerase-like protein